MKQRHPQARQKMSRVIDEIGAALFACGATEVSLRLKKEPEGLRLLVQSDYTAENRPKLERLSKLLQPEIRDPALAETFWELAGADLAHDTSELALVGQILDGAHVAIEDAGVPVTPIEEFTGYPEMMDGRVKTLHPKVHGALLARRDSEQHMQEAAQHGIKLIDLVVVNLYEFEKTVANPEVTFADAIEHIDIGGPSMLRSAAKNAASVTVISDPADYDAVLAEMRETGGCTTLSTRRRLQVKVYQTTAAYDTAISRWLAAQASDVADTSAKLEISLEKVDDLRYGENPQQKATVYRFAEGCENTASSQFPLVGSEQIQGKPLSYNNYLDADAAWNLVREFDEPACVILKHQNPCGSAVAEDITAAYDRAFACDPKSAFGGIIACNREVPYELVEHFADQNKQFVEVIIAPSYTAEALERMAKRPNLRVLATGGVDHGAQVELRSVDGGMLVQEVDHVTEDPATFTFPTDRKPTDAEMAEL